MGFNKEQRNSYVKGGMQIAGNTTFQGNVNIEGSMAFEETLAASSNATVAGTFTATKTITGSSKVTSSLLLTGSSKATINNLLTASSKATVTKLLTGSSKATINNTLTASSGFLGTANSSFSGTLKVDNTLTGSSKATVTNLLTASSGLIQPVTTVTTGDSAINAIGHTRISAPSTGSKAWTLGTPIAGQAKTIQCVAMASTLSPRNVLCATAISYITTGSTTANKIRFFKKGDSVTLVAGSASEWSVTNIRGTTLFSNSTTTT